MADIHNVDARLEFYPNDEGDVLSAGVFYKHLNQPIERIRTDARIGSGLPAISFQNAGRAEVKGLEIELRKTLNVLPGKFFRNFSIMGNITLINSQVVKDSNDVKKDLTAIAGISGYHPPPASGTGSPHHQCRRVLRQCGQRHQGYAGV